MEHETLTSLQLVVGLLRKARVLVVTPRAVERPPATFSFSQKPGFRVTVFATPPILKREPEADSSALASAFSYCEKERRREKGIRVF